MWEIDETLQRLDLTPTERKDHALRREEIIRARKAAGGVAVNGGTNSRKSANGTNSRISAKPKAKTGPKDSWFASFYEDANIPKKTANNWWEDYKSDCGVSSTPAKASPAEQERFRQWLRDREEAKTKPTT